MFTKHAIRSTLLLLAVLGCAATGVRAANILFVSAMDEATDPSDEPIRLFLESLGHTVTVFDDDETEADTEEAAAAADVVFISESVSSGGIRTEITEIETPMVITEAWGWDEMGLTLGDGGGLEVATADIEIITPGHPLAAGLKGTVAVLDNLIGARGQARFALGQAGDDATVIARATLEDGVTYDVIFIYEKGATLPRDPADGSPAIAADIRICLGFDELSYLVWNENAYALLEAAINYALGERPRADLAGNPDPADGDVDVPCDATLTWAPGESAIAHDVYLGTDLDDVNLAGRADQLDVLVSQGQDANAYDPAAMLEFGQMYHWRVDEIGAPPDNTIVKGPVWTFTTELPAYPVEAITVTTNATSQGEQGPANTINGSGLDGSDRHSKEPDDMWLGVPADGEPLWLQYEFDRVYKLTEMWVWNYNVLFELALGFGLKDVTVEYSIDGTEWLALGDYELAQAPAAEPYAHNTTVDFGGNAAKYVRLVINSNWGALPQYGLSEVRFLYIPTYAREPEPSTGQIDLSPDVLLSWRAGREAVSHEVCLSTDVNAVWDGTALVATVSETTYDPGPLDFGSTYYWKIVEVNEAEATPSWAGDIWNFVVQEYAVVDGFEDYDDADNRIFNTWLDGWINETGSTVGYIEAPFAEQKITYGGSQSMPLQYNNADSPWYSEAGRTFATPQNWAANGADTLLVHFRGNPVDFLERADGSIVMGAAGTDIWNSADEFRFVSKALTGDASIVVRVDSVLEMDPWTKAGVMIRESVDAGSKFAAVYITSGNGCRFHIRAATNSAATSDTSVATAEQMAITAPYWVKLERSGNEFSGFYSADGSTWTPMVWNPQTISMLGTIHIGLALTSHNAGNPTVAEFSGVATTGNVTGNWEVATIGVPQLSNDPEQLYVWMQDTVGNAALINHPDPEASILATWQEWAIPLGPAGAMGVDLGSIASIVIGVGDRVNPQPGGTGTVYVDEIAYGHPAASTP